MDENLIKISGRFTFTLFHNDENFYTVAKLKVNNESGKTVIVTGSMVAKPDHHIMYNLYGYYSEHPRYGLQFQFVRYEKALPADRDGIIKYLSGQQFDGVGKKTAAKIVDELGVDCIKMIKADPSVLKRIPALSENNIKTLSDVISQSADGMEDLLGFLNIQGISMRLLTRINDLYGRKAVDVIKDNPYKVIEKIEGFGFEMAERLAQNLGFSKDDPRRLNALMIHLISEICMASGDTYVKREELEEKFRRLCSFDVDFADVLHQVILKRGAYREDERIYPKAQYIAEKYIAFFLRRFPFNYLEMADYERIDKYLSLLQEETGIEYDEKQRFAIKEVMDNPFSIITGGPGTGKTTLVRALSAIYQLTYPSQKVVCAAPTGRAAKRLSELTGCDAMTIHSLLCWDMDTNFFAKNENEPITCDFLIVDEFSMVDNYLFYKLLNASVNVRKICVIGDEDQLPSVSPGSLLRDLIETDLFPLIRLTHIYRQEAGSDVIALSYAINNGEIDFENFRKDVAFFETSPEQIRDMVLESVKASLNNGYAMDDIQVLSPQYNGNAGIDVLNRLLQTCFNPKSKGKDEVKYGYITFREGDKVMQLKNMPDDAVYNGDIGKIADISETYKTKNPRKVITVDFDGNFVSYASDSWQNLTLAYCISVHKAQGNEYPCVIMPISPYHAFMLQRKLIYTAVTRASHKLILIGDKNAFNNGIAVIERHSRLSSLRERILSEYRDNKEDVF